MSVILDQVTKYYGKQKAPDVTRSTLREGKICGFQDLTKQENQLLGY